MTDTTAKIRAKGLDATGVTDEIAREMYNNLGKHYMAIVEIKVTSHAEDNDGKRSVDLVINQLEPATSEDMADHLREITRTCYYNRGNGGQLTLTQGTDEPTVEGVLAAGIKHKPHPFLPVDTDVEHPICDVCGGLGTAPVHSQQDMLEESEDADGSDPTYDEVDSEGNPVDPDEAYVDEDEDEADGPHAYDAGPDDVCQCGLPFEDDTHRYVGETGVTHDGGPVEVEEERHLSAVGDPFTP